MSTMLWARNHLSIRVLIEQHVVFDLIAEQRCTEPSSTASRNRGSVKFATPIRRVLPDSCSLHKHFQDPGDIQPRARPVQQA